MSRVSPKIACGVVAVTMLVSATSASAQIPGRVRVVKGPGRIQGWYRVPDPRILFEAPEGTTLEVLDREGDWFWVIVPADVHGTRRAGWIRARDVEPVPASATSVRGQDRRNAAVELTRVSPTHAVPATPTDAADSVILTADTASTRTDVPTATKAYAFEDVHFERNRSSLRQEDMDALRSVVTALNADPSLVVTIEGHTCSLGAAVYNVALGTRRANAVKNYFLSEGITADRLRLVSLGEEHPKHDNSLEQTRQLNRRVGFVPGAALNGDALVSGPRRAAAGCN